MSGLDWTADGACIGSGLPWTEFPGTYPLVLVDAMRATCAACTVFSACAGYAAENATAGFWTGVWRTHPAEDVQDVLPFDTEEGVAA